MGFRKFLQMKSVDKNYLPSKYAPLWDESDSGRAVLASWAKTQSVI